MVILEKTWNARKEIISSHAKSKEVHQLDTSAKSYYLQCNVKSW